MASQPPVQLTAFSSPGAIISSARRAAARQQLAQVCTVPAPDVEPGAEPGHVQRLVLGPDRVKAATLRAAAIAASTDQFGAWSRWRNA
jgi:hypothetical protein